MWVLSTPKGKFKRQLCSFTKRKLNVSLLGSPFSHNHQPIIFNWLLVAWAWLCLSGVGLGFNSLKTKSNDARQQILIILLKVLGLWHSHKVSGSMGSRYGVAVRRTLLARDFYTSGRKWTREPGSGSTNPGQGSKVVNPFYVTMVCGELV
jgi:hypothetical protein